MQPLLAVFAIYPSRARFVILDIPGQDCAAALATDRYASYARIGVEHRQICWADLLRDLNRSGQRHGLPGQIGRRLLGLGLVMVRWRERGLCAGARLEGLQRRTQATLLRGSQQHARSPTSHGPGAGLIRERWRRARGIDRRAWIGSGRRSCA